MQTEKLKIFQIERNKEIKIMNESFVGRQEETDGTKRDNSKVDKARTRGRRDSEERMEIIVLITIFKYEVRF